MHMGKRRNPAIVAGLAGALSCAAPSTAQAATLGDLASSVFSTPETAFVAGGVMGAVVAGAVSGIVCHALMSRDARAAAGEPQAAVEAPSERIAAHSRAVVKSFNEEPKPAAAVAAAPAAASSDDDDLEAIALAYAARKRGEDAPKQAPSSAAHAERPAADEPAEPVPSRSVASGDAGNAPARSKSHEATDYEDIAANYVKKLNFRERMASRAAGVASTLQARMGASMMEGLPVISRADGSVADVGTSWWNTSVGIGSITKVEDYVDGDSTGNLAIPSDFSASPQQQLAEAAKGAAAEFARAGISDRVAFVDEGVFPEKRSVDQGIGEDDWACALRSMDERLNSQFGLVEPPAPVVFEDVVGDADTLDEPDGLEQSTSFIPFKTPAGHPEVVDTESYVDYLIGDEFGRNSSKAARSGAGRFLRLLEGGTSTNKLTRVDDAPARPRAKHFAQPPMAAEA